MKIWLATVLLTFILFTGGSPFIVSASATSDPGQSAMLQKREGFAVYNNTDYGFQLLYPQDWAVIEGDSEPGDYVTNIVFFEPPGEKGKHYSKKYPCGEVCLGISIDNAVIGGSTLQQYSDGLYNELEDEKGPSTLLDYNSETEFTLGGKRAFEMVQEHKQGNREYIQKFIGATYPDPDANESKAFLVLQSKTRDKYSDEMLPLAQTIIDSFRFTENKK